LRTRNFKSEILIRIKTSKVLLVAAFTVFCFLPALAQNEIQTTPTNVLTEEVKPLPKKPPESPLMINADRVEYLSDSKDVSAEGNVEIIYKGTKLTCTKILVNTMTKDGQAEGKVRLEDAQGVIEGDKLSYNFQTKSGFIDNAQFRMNPYFGKARHLEKVSEEQIAAFRGYFSTCNFDRPHFRISARKLNLFPKAKIESRDDIIYLGSVPVACLPHFSRSLTDKETHFQATPGTRKDWGPYILSNYRIDMTPNLNGRIYVDYRNRWGFAEGLGFNYNSPDYGRLDAKFYYTDMRPDNMKGLNPSSFIRYLGRLRYKWDIGKQTNIVSEYYNIKDQLRKESDPSASFLRDYFYREYEKSEQPSSYIQVHHNFSYSSLDLLFQTRTVHWFGQLDKHPELKYSLPSVQIGETPLYFESYNSLANYNKQESAMDSNLNVARFDTVNKFSIPLKISFLQFKPFVGSQETVYDKGADGKNLPVRTIFTYGAEASTKFYRLFDINTNIWGLDINKLRHIITPTISYTYNHTPTIPASDLNQIDSVDALTSSNAATLQLNNKLQTKRDGVSVDLAEFLVTTSYNFTPNYVSGNKLGGSFQDVLFQAQLIPYSWMRIVGNATYKHSGVPTDADYGNYNHFSETDYNIDFTVGRDRSFGIGQRYERMGDNELTLNFIWRLNPKWKFGYYQRYNIRHYWNSTTTQSMEPGMLEQQFTLSRDLHCWEMDFTVDSQKNGNSSIYLIFRVKAFPENDFGFDQVYHGYKPGTQQ